MKQLLALLAIDIMINTVVNRLIFHYFQLIALMYLNDQQIHSMITFNYNASSHNSIGGLRPHATAPLKNFKLNT